MYVYPWHTWLLRQVTLNQSTCTYTSRCPDRSVPAHCAHWQAHACTYPEEGCTHTVSRTQAYTHIYLYVLWLSASWALLAALARAALIEKVWWRSWTLHSHLCVSPTSHSHLPTMSPIPRSRAGNAQRTLIQGTYLFREVSQRRLHTVAHNMLKLPFRWTWL